MTHIRYGSVCSGIEAATAAWHHIGWEAAFFSEIEKFPRAVLRHHYPRIPLHGRDQGRRENFAEYAKVAGFQTIGAEEYGAIDLLVGGTPCQSFSIAGLRGGLDDDRGNLALEFCRLADRKQPRWLVWENVPGVLSSNGGRDFGSILGAMAELGYGVAYRVLDAQNFGVPQRRRRVFVVGYLGDWRRAAAVLFEQGSLRGNYTKGDGKNEEIARTLRSQPQSSHRADSDNFITWPVEIAPTLNAHFGEKQGFDNQHIRGGRDGLSVSQCLTAGTGQRYDPETETLIPTHGGEFDVVHGTQDPCVSQSKAFALGRNNGGENVVSFGIGDSGVGHCLRSEPSKADKPTSTTYVGEQRGVRRLMPTECERLQGFPDGYTDIPYKGRQAPDGPRYKSLGNSMAVPCMRWIGERIQKVDQL